MFSDNFGRMFSDNFGRMLSDNFGGARGTALVGSPPAEQE
jgi:hypothetical protein